MLKKYDDGWTIQNVYNKKCLDVDAPNIVNNGKRVVALDVNESSARRWEIRYDDQLQGWR